MYWYWYCVMPLFRVRQKLTLEMAETHMRKLRGAWGFEFCRPFPVPGKLGFFYVHTRSVHGAACLTSSSDGSSSDGRRTRRYPKHETGQDGEDRKIPCPHRHSNSRPSDPEESALSTRPQFESLKLFTRIHVRRMAWSTFLSQIPQDYC